MKTAAAAAGTRSPSGRDGRDEREVRPARRLDPGHAARRDEARRDRGAPLDRREIGRERGEGRGGRRWSSVLAAYGASGSCSRPAGLGQAVDEVERLDRLAGGALHEVVDRRRSRGSGRSARRGGRRPGRGCCRGRASWPAPRRRPSRTARRRRRRRTASSSSAWLVGRVGRTWPADRMPAGHRDQVGQEVDPRRPGSRAGSAPSRASSCSISATWRWPPIPYAFTLSLTSPNIRSGLASRPAPETPLLASMTRSSIRPARASGARASSVAGRIAAGVADDRDGGVAERRELGAMELGQPVDGVAEEVRRAGARSRTSAGSRRRSRRRKSGPRSMTAVPAADDRRDDPGGGPVGEGEEDGVDVRQARLDRQPGPGQVRMAGADRLVCGRGPGGRRSRPSGGGSGAGSARRRHSRSRR